MLIYTDYFSHNDPDCVDDISSACMDKNDLLQKLAFFGLVRWLGLYVTRVHAGIYSMY